jgi:DNA invertase Pin-like site-specific DNA recombinase
MQTPSRNAAVIGRLIRYARVSSTDPQLDDLRADGCDTVREEHASGADRTRPVLASLLREIRPGETLVGQTGSPRPVGQPPA